MRPILFTVTILGTLATFSEVKPALAEEPSCAPCDVSQDCGPGAFCYYGCC